MDGSLCHIVVQHNTFLANEAHDLILCGSLLLGTVVGTCLLFVVEGRTDYFLIGVDIL